jgi:hypothetical protein
LAIWPDPLDQLDDRLSAEEQPPAPAANPDTTSREAGPPAEQAAPAEAQRPQRRLHNKPKTLARNERWQARINDLDKSSPGKSRMHYCGILAKEPENKDISPRTIHRVTKPPLS